MKSYQIDSGGSPTQEQTGSSALSEALKRKRQKLAETKLGDDTSAEEGKQDGGN